MSYIKMLVVVVALFVASDSPAQIIATEVKVAPFFANMQSSLQIKDIDVSHDSLAITKNPVLYELSGSVYTRHASLRGYYLFPKTLNGDGLLPAGVANNKNEALPSVVNVSLNSCRLELAVPVRISQAFMVEPLLTYQSITPSIQITGKEFSYNSTSRLSGVGVGVELTENLSNSAAFKVKYISTVPGATTSSSLFQLRLNAVDRNMMLGVGYDWWTFNIDNYKSRVQGPTVEVGVRF